MAVGDYISRDSYLKFSVYKDAIASSRALVNISYINSTMQQSVAERFQASRSHSVEDERSVILNTIATQGVKVHDVTCNCIL